MTLVVCCQGHACTVMASLELKSEFDENYGDRLWEISCGKIGLFDGDDICMWTSK